MVETISVLGVMGFVMLMMIGVLVMIGRTVYKDAKSLGLNATMWTLIAVFVPNLIGVIIYLVVRSNTPKVMKCSKCENKVDESYNVCPDCGSHFTSFCKQCKKPVKAGLRLCPYCGETAEDLDQPTAHKLSAGTNIGKSLGITLAVFFGTMILVFGCLVGIALYSESHGYSPDLSIMNVENNTTNKFSNRFFYRDGRVKTKFQFGEGEDKIINGTIEVKEGSIQLAVENSQGEAVYQQQFVPQEELYTVRIDLSQNPSTEYKAYISYDEARGSVELSGK